MKYNVVNYPISHKAKSSPHLVKKNLKLAIYHSLIQKPSAGFLNFAVLFDFLIYLI